LKGYRDIVGDGGSDIVRQVVEHRARIDRAVAGVRHVVAVGSGKGGVGKSTLTYQLACALAERGSRAAILDADLNGPCQARLAGVGDVPPVPRAGDGALELPRDRHGIGVATMGSFVPESVPVEFDSIAAGAAHTWRATRELTFLGQLLGAVAWGELDWLLVDLPPGTERTEHAVELLGERASVVLVTLPSAVAGGVVARTVRALDAAGRPAAGYVVNMRGYCCPGCGGIEPLFPEVDHDFGIPCLGNVPFDPRVAAASDRGLSLDAAGPAGRAVRDIAARLTHVLDARIPNPTPAVEHP
jgi:ATP-binding protein involved in chromosome partitioning